MIELKIIVGTILLFFVFVAWYIAYEFEKGIPLRKVRAKPDNSSVTIKQSTEAATTIDYELSFYKTQELYEDTLNRLGNAKQEIRLSKEVLISIRGCLSEIKDDPFIKMLDERIKLLEVLEKRC